MYEKDGTGVRRRGAGGGDAKYRGLSAGALKLQIVRRDLVALVSKPSNLILEPDYFLA
jgi:hypothetical protein